MKSKKALLFLAIGAATAALALAACSPSAPAPSNGGSTPDPDSEPIAWTWSADMDCTGCHSAQAKSAVTAAHNANGTTCTDCHSGDLKGVHANAASGKTPDKLSAKMPVTSCTQAGCHKMDQADFEALSAQTGMLTDLKGTTVNAHTVIGLTDGHKDIVCADCHVQHGDAMKASDVCVVCHHAGEYTCGTCH